LLSSGASKTQWEKLPAGDRQKKAKMTEIEKHAEILQAASEAENLPRRMPNG